MGGNNLGFMVWKIRDEPMTTASLIDQTVEGNFLSELKRLFAEIHTHAKVNDINL